MGIDEHTQDLRLKITAHAAEISKAFVISVTRISTCDPGWAAPVRLTKVRSTSVFVKMPVSLWFTVIGRQPMPCS